MTKAFPTLSDYDILAELGKGGMGVVYKARQRRLERLVALKVIRINYLADDDVEVLRRFQREARAAAALRHPNIVLVYDFDQQDDLYFITMELVEGSSLGQIVQERGQLPVEVACDYVRQCALGLQHAFEHGMVHRDIKPANLLIQPASPQQIAAGQSPHGAVKILDMGLVYFPTRANESQLTVHGTVIGTPDYMAPEQTLDSHSVDIRSDLYSLGCTFYFLLAGKAPFGEQKLMQKLLAHQTRPPRSIHEVRPDVPAHIANVLDRLLAKKQEDRFQTPQELADALSQTTPIDTDEASIHSAPRPASIFDTMGTFADTGATFSTTDTPREAVPEGPPAPQRFAVLKKHGGAVTALAFAPNRRVLASGGADGALRMWSLGSQPDDRVLEAAHPGDISRLAFAADNEMLASGSSSYEGLIRLWICHGTHAQAAGNIPVGASTVAALEFSPDRRYLAAGGSDKLIRVWDVKLAAPKLVATLKGHQSEIKALIFPANQELISVSLDGAVRVWDLTKFWSKEVAAIEGKWGQVHSLAASPRGDLLALGCLDEKVHLCATADGRVRQTLLGHAGVVRVVQFDREGTNLLSVCDRGAAVLWEAASGAKLREWKLPAAQRTCLSVTLDIRYLAAGGADGNTSLFRFYARRER